jgi:uncharacterized membrane protein
MRHHDTNQMDVKILDGNRQMMVCQMKTRRVNRWMKGDLMTDDRMKILVMKSANYYRHDLMDVSLNYYLRTYLFLISLVVARYLVVLCNIFYCCWCYSCDLLSSSIADFAKIYKTQSNDG